MLLKLCTQVRIIIARNNLYNTSNVLSSFLYCNTRDENKISAKIKSYKCSYG
jgi:hypothetical protein